MSKQRHHARVKPSPFPIDLKMSREPEHASRSHTPRPERARYLVGALALLLAVCACDVRGRGGSDDDPVPECVEYAGVLRACAGNAAGARAMDSFAVGPSDKAARAQLANQCAVHRDRMRLVCH